MLVIDHVHRAVRNQDGVGSAEALFHPAREVHPLLDQDDRVRAGFFGGRYQFKDVGGIAGGAVIHLLVEPGEVLGGVLGLHAQRLPELVLAERVGVSALSGVVAAFVGVALTEPCRWRTVEPAVRGRSGEKRVSIRWHC